MKLLLKIATIVLLPLIGLVVLALVLAWVYVDSLTERGVERGATYALGVPTTLDSADVGVLTGSVELAGLEVSNPDGFEADHFLKLDDADMDVSLGSLMEDTVEVPSLVLEGIDLRLERTLEGANYNVILDNLSRFESGEKEEADPSDKKFVIRTIEVRNVRVHVDAVPVGGAIGDLTTAEVTVDEVVLRDVGTAGEPMSIAEITTVVLKAVLASAVEVGGGVLPDDVLSDIGDQLASLLDLEAMGVGGIEELGEAIEGVGDTIEEAGDAIRDAGEELGGLLGGDKKKEEEPKDPG